ALARQALARGELRFGEREAVGCGDAHHLARGAHFRAEDGVYAAELVERKYRRLYGVELAHCNFCDTIMVNQWKIHVGKLSDRHQWGCNSCERYTGGLADVRHGA